MKPTISWIKTNFDVLNKVYFQGKLPHPKFSLARSQSFYGQFRTYCPYQDMTAKEVSAKHGIPHGELRMSSCFNRPEKCLVGTLLHEMIHMLQFERDEKPGHLKTFRECAKRLNVYGWDIKRCGGAPSDEIFEAYKTYREILG